MTAEQMKQVDIRTVNPNTLTDRSSIRIDHNAPRENRLRQYLKQIGNPYCYVDEGVVVKVSFASCTESLEDRMQAYIRSM